MKNFLMLSIAYFCMSVVVVLVTRDNGFEALQTVAVKSGEMIEVFGWVAGLMVFLGVMVALTTKTGAQRAVIWAVLVAFLGSIFLQGGFFLFKTSMPYIIPFYADVAFAGWDRALHGGVDPWVWTHKVADHLPMNLFIPFYLHVWVWPSICLPLFIAATDRDAERIKRTMLMYGIGWIFIGNVLALAGMSAGPVFYDRLYGGDDFAALTTAIAQTPAINDYFGNIQESLWIAYTQTDQSIGFGISAFPSVHLSMAMVTALYLWDRSRLLGLIGVGFVAVIMFLSVYSGYHYALDGYVSIIVLWGAWAFMRRRAAAPRRILAQAGQVA
ncbi:phosphatase PAP2 family protein [Octadecabacter sp. CECT 8868]|uniref:phosphatase PAP2 family protein n=1 Tax=Octadecabacter algicola TaxID=2909342 RepID=UPI001F2C255D|nr:phosphatase PAP2 family protein [Octadecabacter algicola]MCF2905242.1 phosphatase PAP2 family protein [Octadecabacter algicola]